jgi:hypothetical protein
MVSNMSVYEEAYKTIFGKHLTQCLYQKVNSDYIIEIDSLFADSPIILLLDKDEYDLLKQAQEDLTNGVGV